MRRLNKKGYGQVDRAQLRRLALSSWASVHSVSLYLCLGNDDIQRTVVKADNQGVKIVRIDEPPDSVRAQRKPVRSILDSSTSAPRDVFLDVLLSMERALEHPHGLYLAFFSVRWLVLLIISGHARRDKPLPVLGADPNGIRTRV
jgi:hypothetical protein